MIEGSLYYYVVHMQMWVRRELVVYLCVILSTGAKHELAYQHIISNVHKLFIAWTVASNLVLPNM